jgi:hypothetical protein
MSRATLMPLLLVAGMLLPGWALAAPDPQALLDMLRTSPFSRLTHVAELPPAVLRACVNYPDAVADPGEPFNPTDVSLPGNTTPQTRLVWAATDSEHYVVDFEYGGLGYHQTVLIVDFDNSRGTAKVLAVADGEKVSGIEELIKAAADSKTPFWRDLGRYH